jgi:hypothetical protein
LELWLTEAELYLLFLCFAARVCTLKGISIGLTRFRHKFVSNFIHLDRATDKILGIFFAIVRFDRGSPGPRLPIA